MSWNDYGHLLAERGTLQRMLEGIPEEDVLDRGSFLARLEQVEEQISRLSAESRKPARARLTFRGRPVVDGHGIVADFGAVAVKSFVDAVSAMAASQYSHLAMAGPIPNKDQYQLIVTSTAVGSFGFELEEYRSGQSYGHNESPVALALTRTQDIILSTIGTDDQLLDVVAEVDQRAVASIRTFLGLLVKNDVVCVLEVDIGRPNVRAVGFSDLSQVRHSLDRLSPGNLSEEPESLEGTFQGVLPTQRTFEFRATDREEVIRGRFSTRIGDPDQLNDHLHQRARIRLTTVRTKSGRRRYVLNEQPNWLDEPT